MTACDGNVLKAAFQRAEEHLRGRIEEINALNVFPIPDGDTGTNLHMTMQAVARAVANIEDSSVAKVMSTAARAALLGARGNSGVIFSQILKGLARGLEAKESFSGGDFARALQMACDQAYKTVLNPVEGTILTVLREASEAAERAAQRGEDLGELMTQLLNRAKHAVENTPNLLPVLRDAGVVDAGGQGLYYIFEGLCRSIAGHASALAGGFAPQAADVGAEGHEFGFEVQLLIEGHEMAVDALRARLAGLGDSVLVVGDENLIRVHIHTAQPQTILDIAGHTGKLSDVSVTNLDAQAEEFRQQGG